MFKTRNRGLVLATQVFHAACERVIRKLSARSGPARINVLPLIDVERGDLIELLRDTRGVFTNCADVDFVTTRTARVIIPANAKFRVLVKESLILLVKLFEVRGRRRVI